MFKIMTPIRFTLKNGVTHFHYKESELIDFVRRGKKDGDVGMILTKRDSNMLIYRGFGTIENPFTHIVSILIMHCSLFDGEMPTDEQRLIPPKPFFTEGNTRFVILDLSNENSDYDKERIFDKIQEVILVECSIQCQKCNKDKKDYNTDDYYFVEELIREGWAFKRDRILCDDCS